MKTIGYRFKSSFLAIFFVFCTLSCVTQKKESMKKNKVHDISTGEGKYIITAPIVFKSFIKKNGEASDKKELYIQRSIQDYYIKFCESKVTREELEKQLSKINGLIKALTLEVEYRNGDWDICDENMMQQSRVGKYIIIHRIIANNQK